MYVFVRVIKYVVLYNMNPHEEVANCLYIYTFNKNEYEVNVIKSVKSKCSRLGLELKTPLTRQ